MYHAILTTMKNSFNLIKKRVGKSSGGIMAAMAGGGQQDKPFFEVTVELNLNSEPNVVAKPSLDEVQDAINRTAVAILRSTKRLISWGQDRSADNTESFFDMLAAEKEVCKLVLLLTGSIEGAKKEVVDYLGSFEAHSYLWKNDMQREYSNFLKTEPSLEDFDDELSKYVKQEAAILEIPNEKNIGVLALDNAGIKTALSSFASMWKAQYAKNLLGIARKELETIVEYIKSTNLKFSINVEHLDDVRKLMTMLQEIREKESRIDWDFGPVEEKYELLQKYDVKQLSQDELFQVSELRTMWGKLKVLTNSVADQLGEKQAGFKNDLVNNVATFKTNVKGFRTDYEKNGPTQPNIKPYDAIDRLNKYDREFTELDRKYTMFNAGEVLFGMPQTQLDAMEKTGKEIKLLKQLYGLYQNVDNTVAEYNDILWIDVVSNIESMTTQVNEFQRQCKGMPRALKEWDAYEELRKKIEDLLESLPLLQYLSNKSMRSRHWNQVMEATGCTFKTVSYTHLRAHETPEHLVCRLLLEKKKKKKKCNKSPTNKWKLKNQETTE
eukprot:TRINITY_DN61143_c0_g1_i1.p1 TRINITY_DN61143_c0_g1~~TRINITY_DN61143_c0_g1_i1.p1  ORF type:complete len:552 (-),score=211.72 TRINITY_DN61143_c0_g1_i1:10-1665(-)